MAESESINLVGEQMCEECDAFLGKAHKDGCSKHGRVVEVADATEKFTTAEHANQENPMLGIDLRAAKLIQDNLGAASDGESADLQALREGLRKFIQEAEG